MSTKTLNIEADFFHLARLALTGRGQDVQLLLHRVIKRYRATHPGLTDELVQLLREAPTRESPLRRQSELPLPVDSDTRLKLLRVEENPAIDHPPIFAGKLGEKLAQLVAERQNPTALIEAGLHPSKTALFVGPPGVGKTLAARWLAKSLGRPLLILDLAAVMSSYLGRTGGNLRHVLDYAKEIECLLLLDELDAIAKRRDDSSEIGELKRLVTVLIQEIDDWPPSGLLVAATNHPDLLDPAIWRRFEMVLPFPLPDTSSLSAFISDMLESRVEQPGKWGRILALSLGGRSFSDVERELVAVRRAAALEGRSLEDALIHLLRSMPDGKAERIELASLLVEEGIMSQRQASDITGIARDTIRRHGSTSNSEVDS